MRRYFMLPLLLLLAGCGTQVLMQGEPNFNTAILLPYPPAQAKIAASRDVETLDLVPKVLPAECPSAAAAATPDKPPLPVPNPAPPAATLQDVEKCVYAVKAIIDDLYREYRITLHHFADDGNAAADITVLGLTTAATGPVGTTAKTILSGFATFVGGSKSILNQDLLYQKAIEDIINQMDIDRDTQFKTMLQQIQGSKYTMEQAKADLLEYFAAGTWDHAIVSLQTTVAAKKANCKAQTDATKVAVAQGTQPASDNNASAPAASPGPSGSSAPAPAKPADCGPTTAQAPGLTPDVAKAGKIFATTAQTFVLVVTQAKIPTDNITIEESTSSTDFSHAKTQTIKFSTFVLRVKPVPIN